MILPYKKHLSEGAIQTIYEESPDEVKKALEPFGYFHANIQSRIFYFRDHVEIHFFINLGNPIRIRNSDIRVSGPGSNIILTSRIIQKFSLQSGEIFQTQQYQKAKEEIFQQLYNQGYIKAFLEKNIVLINLKKCEVEIILHMQTGPRYFFGPVTFINEQYAPSFLQRFNTISSSEPFSSEKLAAYQQSLTNNFYFQQVTITPDFDHAVNYHVPLTVQVVAPKSQRYMFGLGYGSFTGPRITTGMSLRRLNATGNHFDAQLKLSSVLSTIVGKFYMPGKNPLTDEWVMGGNFQRFLPKNGTSSATSLFGGFNKKWQNWQTNINLNYLYEQFKVSGFPAQTSHLLYPEFTSSYRYADNVMCPTFGTALEINLKGTRQEVFSSTSFLQGEIKAKYLFSPFDFSHILLRTDLGYTTVRDINALPLSMRFFAGGINTIRGYPDSSIGPGRYLQVFSAEYQNRIVGNWSGAVFYDFGSASDHFGKPYFAGRGIGIIYQSFIGPVKLYVAQAVTKPDHPVSFELSIGPEF